MNTSSFWFEGQSGPGPDPGSPIGHSLRFRDTVPTYLSNTALVGATLGSYTCSFWVKRGFPSDASAKYLLTSGSAGTNADAIAYNSDGASPAFLFRTAGGTAAPGDTGIVHVDQSAWYHVVCAYDQLNQKATIYINGEQQHSGDIMKTMCGCHVRWTSLLLRCGWVIF
jgi:hypothetical protein